MTQGTHRRRTAAPRRVFQIAAISLLAVLFLCTAAYAISTVWTRMVDGSAHADDRAESIALAPNGDLYAVGYRANTGESRDIWIRKYDPNGTTKWTRVVSGSANIDDAAHDVAVDATGNLYVVGYINPSGGSRRIWIRKYNSSGTKLWTRIVTGTGSYWDTAEGAAVDSNDNLYVVGHIYVSGENYNIWIRKYNSAGVKRWTTTYDGPDDLWARGNGISINSTNRIYATGSTTVSGEDDNIWVRKYRQ